MSSRTFAIHGEVEKPLLPTASDDLYALDTIYQVAAPSRDGSNQLKFELDDKALAELQFSDGTVWFADHTTINDVFPELEKQQRDGTVTASIPMSLRGEDDERGAADIILKAISLFRKKDGADLLDKGIHHLAGVLEDKQLDQGEGLFKVSPGFVLQKQTAASGNAPWLLFLHGTASSTVGSFGKLYGSPAWSSLTEAYADRVLAYQHRTLTKHPLTNVLELLQQLPDTCELHLVSHSRGGLVGDVLSRFCAVDKAAAGFSERELTYWRTKAGKSDYADTAMAINRLLDKKNIRVTKFVRVACPAAGTTLAGKRIEYFFNVTLNLLGMVTGQNANPVYAAFKNLIGEIIKKKDDPDALPGLEAQNPDGAFIKVLNNGLAEKPIDVPLHVIAGHSRIGFSFRALAVIVTRLFFIGKNDMVVNTSSMTNGARRADNKTLWLYDEGEEVNHFNYFANSRTQKAMLAALIKTDEDIRLAGFSSVAQRLSDGALRNAKLGIEGGDVFYNQITGKRPIAVLIPGIMGSNLEHDGDKIWINYWRFVTGGLTRLQYTDESNKCIEAKSLIRTSYKQLADHLRKDYDVYTYAFDWRLPMQENAKAFALKVQDWLKAKQPIKIIGHSMDGVLVRDLMVFEHNTWRKLNESAGFQLLFLGSPLGGSFRIPYVLYGYDSIIKLIAKIDLQNSMEELLAMFSKYRGLLCLLPLTTEERVDFANLHTWQQLTAKLGKPADWPLPDQDALKAFEQYRNTILGSSEKIHLNKAAYIAGKDKATPADYRENPATGRYEFVMTAAGDQSVTWETGIPRAMTEASNVYYAQATHGALANDPKLFDAIDDLLKFGKTDRLPKEAPAIRGKRQFVARDTDDVFDLSEDGLERTLLALGDGEAVEELPPAKTMQVRVNHGDLMYAVYPVLAGHFKNDGLFSVEKAIDWHLEGELQRRVKLGLYPGDIGTYDLLLLNQNSKKKFKGALIVGLGESGKLTAYMLTQTVEKGVLKYLTVYNADNTRMNFSTGRIGLSTPAIGSGYGGLSVETSLRSIITGIQNANNNIRLTYGPDAMTVEDIEFIEIFNDRALDYIYGLSKLSNEKDSGLSFRIASKKIGELMGRRQRIPMDDTTDWWTRITVRLTKEKDNKGKWHTTGIRYNLSTNAAREEECSIRVNLAVIERLLEDASTNDKWNEDLARTIYELLIPNEFKEYLNKQTNVYWIVDRDTAAFPWELLKHAQEKAKPLSVTCGMMRQLATTSFRSRINQVASRTALVVADPMLEGWFNQLSGALEEGHLVEKMLRTHEYDTTALMNRNAADILVALFSKEYKMLHLCGHGLFDTDPNEPSGMLIGKEAVLTPAEINQMVTVPEFVFVNCCHLGAVNANTELLTQGRYKLAANLGTQLIDIGVKAVIVAGWAVDDAAALVFAEQFYQSFFAGDEFGQAVLKARMAAYQHSGRNNNTWGAYQTYGDPFYVLDANKLQTKSKGKRHFVVENQVEMELFNLKSKQETGTYSRDEIEKPLKAILDEAQANGLLGIRSMEHAAHISANLGDYAAAINWYQQLLSGNKAGFDIRSLEQYCNVRTKYALEQYEVRKLTKDAARKEINLVIKDLESLIGLAPNGERFSLLGSTLKRLYHLQSAAEKRTTVKKAIDAYEHAIALVPHGKKYYPMTNWVSLLALRVASKEMQWGKDGLPAKSIILQMLDDETKHCSRQAGISNDYWDMMAIPNLQLARYMVQQNPKDMDQVKAVYTQIWANAGTAGNIKAEMEQLRFLITILEETDAAKDKFGKKLLEDLNSLYQLAAEWFEQRGK